MRILVFAAIALCYFAIPNARPDFTRFNCHDSEAYLSLSYGMAHGLGYTRSMNAGQYVGHTTWPPAVPFLMLPAVAMSGERINWWLAKGTMITIGLLGVPIVWKLVRRCGGSPTTADLTALAIALSPFYWDFSHQVMAEMPLIVWLWVSLSVIDVVWAGGAPKPRGVFAVGVLAGLGMLIKGHAIGLLFAPLAYARRRPDFPRGRMAFVRLWLLFCVGFFVPFGAWTARNRTVEAPGFDGMSQVRMIRTRTPTDPNSPLMTLSESFEVALANVKHYAIYRIPTQVVPGLWPERAMTWSRSGFLFLPLTLLIVAMCIPGRSGPNGLQLVVVPIVLLNVQYALGGAARFWVPIGAILTVLVCVRIGRWLDRLRPRSSACLVVAAGFLLAANLGLYVSWHERNPFSVEGPWRALAELAESSRTLETDVTGVFVCNPQAFQLISGRRAPMRGDYDHVVINRRDPTQSIPAGTDLILSSPPLELHRLASPMNSERLSALGLGAIGP